MLRGSSSSSSSSSSRSSSNSSCSSSSSNSSSSGIVDYIQNSNKGYLVCTYDDSMILKLG